MIAPEVVAGETELAEFDDLSARALNLFKRFSLRTVDDLAAWLSQAQPVRNIGARTLVDLRQIVESQQAKTRIVSVKDALSPFLDVHTTPQDACVADVLEQLRQRLELEVQRLYAIACRGTA